MTRKQRLLATLRGEEVDRPAINFYEVGGFIVDPSDMDEYNVYNSGSWQALLKLSENYTDLIRMMSPVRKESHVSWDNTFQSEVLQKHVSTKNWETRDSRFTKFTYKVGRKELTSLTRRDQNVDTLWTSEPLLKNIEDVKTFLDLPDEIFTENIDLTPLQEQEKSLGDNGIVMVDTEDPVCAVATLFSLEDFAMFAFTEKELCHKLLNKHAAYINKRTEIVSKKFPGRLWRIYGPEYVTSPFLPSDLFEEYVVRYDKPIIDMIHKHGGFARVHAHGNIKEILPHIVAMGADAIDPIEPPGQGNMELSDIRKEYGEQLVLFGNIEVADIETMPSDRFRQLVRKSIADGTSGSGRGFVLMPSSSPFGREIKYLAMDNYKIMIEEIEKLS